MKIVGVQKTTLLDFPGKIAMTIFTLGCNLRCPYCHNKQIAFDFAKDENKIIPLDDLMKIIDDRKNFIDGIVISGGEPTIQPNLLKFMKDIKEKYGLLIKLDTNGTAPMVVKRAIDEKLIDYVALDIKTSFYRYKEQLNVNGLDVLMTYNILKNSNIDYELRMTCYPEFINTSSLSEIYPFLSAKDRIYIQQCNDKEEVKADSSQLNLFGEILTTNGFNSAVIRGVA